MRSASTSVAMSWRSTEIRLNPSTFQVIHLNSTNLSVFILFTGASEDVSELSGAASLKDCQVCHLGQGCQDLLLCHLGHQQGRLQ